MIQPDHSPVGHVHVINKPHDESTFWLPASHTPKPGENLLQETRDEMQVIDSDEPPSLSPAHPAPIVRRSQYSHPNSTLKKLLIINIPRNRLEVSPSDHTQMSRCRSQRLMLSSNRPVSHTDTKPSVRKATKAPHPPHIAMQL